MAVDGTWMDDAVAESRRKEMSPRGSTRKFSLGFENE